MRYFFLLFLLLISAPAFALDPPCKTHDGFWHKIGEPQCQVGGGAFIIMPDIELREENFRMNLTNDDKGHCTYDTKPVDCGAAEILADKQEELIQACKKKANVFTDYATENCIKYGTAQEATIFLNRFYAGDTPKEKAAKNVH